MYIMIFDHAIYLNREIKLPQISYSPSCLGGDDSDTSTSVGSAKVPTSRPFCMLPSLDHLPAGIAALVSHFKWQRAAVISEEGGRLAAVSPYPVILKIASSAGSALLVCAIERMIEKWSVFYHVNARQG